MLYGAVLAGGKSSRMGKDKKRLVFRGESFLNRAFNVLTSSGAGNILMSGVGEADLQEFPGLAGSVTCVADSGDFEQAGGPPRAVYSLLKWFQDNEGLNEQSLLVIPVDMPLLGREAIMPLIDVMTGEQQEKADAAVYHGEVFPLLLKVSRHNFRTLEQGLESEQQAGDTEGTAGANRLKHEGRAGNRYSMKALLAELNTWFIDPVSAGLHDPGIFTNVNTPEELQACQLK